MDSQQYSIWLEAEEWAPGQWNTNDDNMSVIVTLADQSRWAATFFSYANIESLRRKYQHTGECLGGKYFHATNMILVDEVSRLRIEEVVAHLIATSEFKILFRRVED